MSAFETNEFIFEILKNGNVRLKKYKDNEENCSIPAEISYHSEKYKITEIGKKAFKECKILKTIIIPSTVEIIGKYCFILSSIETVNIENDSNLKTIGESAFSSCEKLKAIKIPPSVENIEECCFNGSSIERIDFEKNSKLKTIGKYAFFYCRQLKMIKIPSNVEYIGEGCFSRSTIENFDIENNTNFVFENGILMTKNKTKVIFCVRTKATVILPSSVETIGEYCFCDSCLSKIDFENNSRLQAIGNKAFFYCEQLKEIKIPNNVERIDDMCFNGSSIEKIDIGINSRLKSIGKEAFGDCKQLKIIQIPSSAEIIGESCFWKSSVNEIYLQGHSSITIKEYCFADIPNDFKVYYYKDCQLFGEGVPTAKHLLIIEEASNPLEKTENHKMIQSSSHFKMAPKIVLLLAVLLLIGVFLVINHS